MRVRIGVLGVIVLVGAALFAASPADPAEGPGELQPGTRAALFVGNNWDGTADIIDPVTFKVLDRFNVVPDLDERMAEILTDPVRLGYFLAIRQLIGEGNDQFVDDMFSSHDGRFVYISRPSLADVVSIDLKTKAIVWRALMEGQRSDHMAVSPDGTRLLVSDSTERKVHAIDTATGKIVGAFDSGDSPHENNYSKDGTRIFHASIGMVYTPADQPVANSSKGDRWFQIVDAATHKVTKRLDIGRLLADNGFGDYSSAVRPMAIAPDEKTAYLQLSFLHGFVVFDLTTDKPVKVVDLPKRTTEPRENYLLDSAHHGLAINPEGTKLCAAGTMDGYAAIVSTSDFKHTLIDGVDKPYWSTNSGDGKYCFVSASGTDKVIVIDYASERKVAEIPVGDHPQRMRMGAIRSEYVGESPTQSFSRPRSLAALRLVRARVKNGTLALRVRVSKKARGKLSIRFGKRRFTAPITGSTLAIRRKVGVRRGVLTISYPGSGQVAADAVRVLVAPKPARLRVTRLKVTEAGRMDLAGKVAARARGKVRVRLSYVGSGTRVRRAGYSATIRKGAWKLRALVPSQARSGGQLSIVYRGDVKRSIRGEQLTRRLRG